MITIQVRGGGKIDKNIIDATYVQYKIFYLYCYKFINVNVLFINKIKRKLTLR